jgi:Bacterial TniB protein
MGRAGLAHGEDVRLRRLQRLGVRVRMLAEVPNLLGGSRAQQRAVRHVLRSLGNPRRLPLGWVGPREASLRMRSAEQRANRFAPCAVPRGQAAAAYASGRARGAAIVPLRARLSS